MQTALMERNQALLQQRVWDAETVLFERWRQLAKNEFFEDLELRNAAKVLWTIKCDRLGYPGVTAESAEPGDPPETRVNVPCV